MACHGPDKKKTVLKGENIRLEHFLRVHPLNGFLNQKIACHGPDRKKTVLKGDNGRLEHFPWVHPLNGFPCQKWLATARTRKGRFC